MIYILTGTIRSGKTTALLDWFNTRKDVDGLLCPDDENGKRYFLKAKSKETFEFEAESDNKATVSIGNFKFLKSAFKEANHFLLSLASETNHNYLIIDELGKLELKNEGLHLSAEQLLPIYMNDKTQHLILVVRDYLLNKIIQHYSITNYSELQKDDLRLLK